MAGSKLKKLSPEDQALARQERNRALAQEETKAWALTYKEGDARANIYKAKRGRPSAMTQEAQDEIIERLTAGQSLTHICELEHMPSPTTVYYWMQQSPSFLESYTRACGGLATVLFHQCLAIADDATNDIIDGPDGPTVNHAAIQRAKLRIDTRMRMAGKMNHKYADKPMLGDNATVTVNTLSVNARDMAPDEREKLRALLLSARANATDA